jgi:hypothetical protein
MENLTYWELETLAKSLDQRISKFNHRNMIEDAEETMALKRKVLRIMKNESIRLETIRQQNNKFNKRTIKK